LTAPPQPAVGRVYDENRCRELFPERSLLLSASVPYRRPSVHLQRPGAEAENEWFVSHSKPLRIREAVSHLCRFAFCRGLGLVFGAHPAISPLLLEAACRFDPAPQPRKRVIIFQSLFFVDKIPPATLELANWQAGELLWTPPDPEAAPTRPKSLTRMREAMASSPGLVAALFIGGMEGLYEEAKCFHDCHPDAPMFALGSTGSAAARLLEQGWGPLDPERFLGRSVDRETLATLETYPLVFERIFADLGLAGR
jgi:hypothetical protein